MEKYLLKENPSLVSKFHDILNTYRHLSTKRFIFALPVPLALEQKHIAQNLKRFEYVAYESSFSFDSLRLVLVFFDGYAIGYSKFGKHYDLSELINITQVEGKENVTIVDAFVNLDKMQIYLTDVLHHDEESYYMRYFDSRKTCLVTLIEEDLDKVRTHVDVFYPDFYNYDDLLFSYDEMKDKVIKDFKRVVFVPKSIPIGINIQRTMFIWERDPYCFLKIKLDKEKKLVELFALNNNYNKSEELLFASISTEEEAAIEFLKDYEGDGVYSMTYSNETFKIKHKEEETKRPSVMRFLEQLFCIYRDDITSQTLFT